jgi:hypothetical protein
MNHLRTNRPDPYSLRLLVNSIIEYTPYQDSLPDLFEFCNIAIDYQMEHSEPIINILLSIRSLTTNLPSKTGNDPLGLKNTILRLRSVLAHKSKKGIALSFDILTNCCQYLNLIGLEIEGVGNFSSEDTQAV